jgi:hypothetical protein
MPEVGSHVLIAHLRRLGQHHEDAVQAAHRAHDAHRTPPEAPEPTPEPIARPGAARGRVEPIQ